MSIVIKDGNGNLAQIKSLASGNDQIPQNYSTIATPNGAAAGFLAAVNPFGYLKTMQEPVTLLADVFDGTVLDGNQWTSSGVTSGATIGVFTINPTNVANGVGTLVSIPSFWPSLLNMFAINITLESGTITTGNNRFWGLGLPPGSFTSATPLLDAIGFEVGVDGILRAVIYVNSTRVFAVALTVPIDGLPHNYTVLFRPGLVCFFLDNFEIPVASSTNLAMVPQNQMLPLRVHSVNGASTTVGTPTLVGSGVAFVDYARNTQGMSDGIYPWRRAAVSNNRQIIYKTFADTNSSWRATTGTTPLATNTVTALRAAAGAGIKNMLVSIQLQNTSATIATVFSILDGAAVIWSCNLPANMASPSNINFTLPLPSTANQAFSVQCSTTGAAVLYNAQGYTEI